MLDLPHTQTHPVNTLHPDMIHLVSEQHVLCSSQDTQAAQLFSKDLDPPDSQEKAL